MTSGDIAWINIAKNACTSWQTALTSAGWKLENLSDYQGRWNEKLWIGLLRDPGYRHTMGVAEFLVRHKITEIVDDQKYSKIVCSLLCDEHTYSVHHMVPYELIQQTNWFVIDHCHYDYEHLARKFCQQYGISIPDIPRLNQSNQSVRELRSKIDSIKEQNPSVYGSVMKNYLERDVFLYATANYTQSRFDI